MGKLLKILLLAGCVLADTSCFAYLEDDQLALGGITVGSTPSYVESIYGAPSEIRHPRSQIESSVYLYGPHFSVAFGGRQGNADFIRTNANNGIATPGGITVGMKSDVVYQIYGTADKTDYRSYASYRGDRGWLVFIFKNGVVTEIKCLDGDV